MGNTCIQGVFGGHSVCHEMIPILLGVPSVGVSLPQ